MTNEAELKIETHIPINYTCSNGVTIVKGTICKNEDPMFASASSSANEIVAGIAQSEKLAADLNNKSVAIFRGGVFRVTCSGTCGVGAAVVTGATANYVRAAASNEENILGIMLEAGTEGQSKLMELRPITMKLS